VSKFTILLYDHQSTLNLHQIGQLLTLFAHKIERKSTVNINKNTAVRAALLFYKERRNIGIIAA